MANYNELKEAVATVIKQNGNQEITGTVLQSTLITIISNVGMYADFAGVAVPATNPGTPDQNLYYIATQPGVYTGFGDGVEIKEAGKVYYLKTNGSGGWQMVDATTASSDGMAKRVNGFYAPEAYNILPEFAGILDLWIASNSEAIPDDMELYLWFVAQPPTAGVVKPIFYIKRGTNGVIDADPKGIVATLPTQPNGSRSDVVTYITQPYPGNTDGLRFGVTIDWSLVNSDIFRVSNSAKLNKNALRYNAQQESRVMSIQERAISKGQYFVNGSDLKGINFDFLLNIVPKVDCRGMFPYGFGLWYIVNGNGTTIRPSIYLSKANADGTLDKSEAGIVAMWQSDPDSETPFAPITGISTVTVKGNQPTKYLHGYGLLEFDFTINWDFLSANDNNRFDLRFNDEFFAQFFDTPKTSGGKVSRCIDNNTYVKDNLTPALLVAKAGVYGVNLNPVLLYSELTWNEGLVWSTSGSAVNNKVPNTAMGYSNPVPLNGATTIKVVAIASSTTSHVFLDINGNPIQFFGANSKSWENPNYNQYTVPSNAVNVSFSWTNPTFGYTDKFKTDLKEFRTIGNWNTLPWLYHGGYWSVSQQTFIATNTLKTTDFVDITDIYAIKANIIPGADFGTAFFDKNKRLIKVLKGKILQNEYSWTNSLGNWRVPANAKYASFTWNETYKDVYVIKESNYIDFELTDDTLTLAVWNDNAKVSNNANDNNGAFELQSIEVVALTPENEDNFNIADNMPILPSQLFLRNDVTVPLFKNSMFTNMKNLERVDVNLICEVGDNGGRVVEINEPTNMGGVDGVQIKPGNARMFLGRTSDYTQFVFKDMQVFLKDVSTLSGKTVKVLSLGDSLTEGLNWSNTPVCMLADELTKIGVTTQFIGTLARNFVNKQGQTVKLNYEGRGGWRYRTMTGLESRFAGLDVVIPTDLTKHEWMLGVDGSTMSQIKANHSFMYPATDTDKQNYPEFCYHFVVGNNGYNQSYADNPNLGDYIIFDPIRYFSERSVDIPDILTIAFGTNEWYLGGFDLPAASKAFKFMVQQFRRASSTMKIAVIPANALNMRRQNFWGTEAGILTAEIIRVTDELRTAGDANLYVCPIYAQSSRWLGWDNLVTTPVPIAPNYDTMTATISQDVHSLYIDDESNNQYAEGLAACAVNLID